MRSFIPRLTRQKSLRSRLVFMVVALCGLYDSLVAILSLGLLDSDTRAAALFEWFPDD